MQLLVLTALHSSIMKVARFTKYNLRVGRGIHVHVFQREHRQLGQGKFVWLLVLPDYTNNWEAKNLLFLFFRNITSSVKHNYLTCIFSIWGVPSEKGPYSSVHHYEPKKYNHCSVVWAKKTEMSQTVQWFLSCSYICQFSMYLLQILHINKSMMIVNHL